MPDTEFERTKDGRRIELLITTGEDDLPDGVDTLTEIQVSTRSHLEDDEVDAILDEVVNALNGAKLV